MRSFNSGVLSPWVDGRYDLDKYSRGLRQCRNFVITPYGAIRRRGGTEYQAAALGVDTKLVAFQPTSEEGFVIEIGSGSTRVYDEGSLVTTLSSPWTGDEVFEVQTEQLNAVMFITHKNHHPRELRYNGSAWSLVEMDLDYPPFQDFTFNGSIAASPSGGVGSNDSDVSLTAIEADGNKYSSSIPIDGDWELDVTVWTSGTDVKVEVSFDNGNNWSALAGSTASSVTTLSGSGVANGLARIYSNSADMTATLTTSVPTLELGAGQAVNLTSSGGVFQAGHVGSEVELTHFRDESEIRISLENSITSDNFVVKGDWLLTTTGIWRGTVYVDVSDDDGTTWEPIVRREAYGDRNISYRGTQSRRARLRVRYEKDGATENDAHATIEALDNSITGRILITGYTNANSANGTVVDGLYSDAGTDEWRLAAWSDVEGYPSAVCWHEQRLYFGGSRLDPAKIWASAIDDFWNFDDGTLDDASFARRIAASEQSDIKWMASHQSLFIGTGGAEWRGFSDSDGGTITPTSFLVRKFSSFGSHSLPAVITGSNLLYVQRQARKVREVGFSVQQDGYSALDLTMLAVHISQGGIRDIAYQASRDSTVWMVTECGRLVGMTYDKSQNVYGWHVHDTFEGYFRSVCCVYEGGDEDSIYVTIEREDKGTYLEKFHKEQYKQAETGCIEDGVFVDSSITQTGDQFTVVTGLDHLENRTVTVLGDGVNMGEFMVASNQITLPSAVDKAVVGLAYTSQIETLPLNFDSERGTTSDKKKVVRSVNLRVWRSVTAEIAPVQRSVRWEKLQQHQRKQHDPDVIPDEGAIGDFEDWEIAIGGQHHKDARCAIRISEPYPLNILSITPQFQITDTT